MTDYFALLNFPRAPWLDANVVQARFLELSAPAHPDRVHSSGEAGVARANEKFAELNKAAAVLRDPKERLHHLIALETGAASAATQNIPDELIDLFSKVGALCRNVDQFIAERSRTHGPMLRAQLFVKGLEWSDGVADLQQQVHTVKSQAEGELQEIARAWPSQKPFPRLAALAHVFAMTTKWESQLQERFAALAAS
jgi:DnaJ-domain-containing protein 1